MGQYSDLTDPRNAPPLWPFVGAFLAIAAIVSFGILWITA